jgi:hypothetical protein
MVELYNHSPIHLYGVVLILLSIATTLTLHLLETSLSSLQEVNRLMSREDTSNLMCVKGKVVPVLN